MTLASVLDIVKKVLDITIVWIMFYYIFMLNHKEFKVQQLISIALEEFLEKYK